MTGIVILMKKIVVNGLMNVILHKKIVVGKMNVKRMTVLKVVVIQMIGNVQERIATGIVLQVKTVKIGLDL